MRGRLLLRCVCFEACCATCVNPKQKTFAGGLFRAALANVPLGAPHVINAILMTQYMSPQSKVLSTLLSEGDLRKLKKRAKLVADANKLLGAVARADDVEAVKKYALFVRVATHLLGKESAFKDTTFKLLTQNPLPGDVQSGDAVPVPAASASSGDAHPDSVQLVRRDDKGQVTDIKLRLQAEGVGEGSFLAQRTGAGGDVGATNRGASGVYQG